MAEAPRWDQYGVIPGGAMSLGALGGGIAGAINSAVQGKKSRKFARKEAKKNRNFQERMSNTAYERAAQDLENAGLNRILAFGGGGASQPGGSTASGADFPNSIAEGIASAMDLKRTGTDKFKSKQMAKQANLAVRLGVKQGKLLDEDVKLSSAKRYATNMQGNVSKMAAYKLDREVQVLDHLMPGIKEEGNIDRSEGGRFLRWMNRFTSSALGGARLNPTGGGKK